MTCLPAFSFVSVYRERAFRVEVNGEKSCLALKKEKARGVDASGFCFNQQRFAQRCFLSLFELARYALLTPLLPWEWWG